MTRGWSRDEVGSASLDLPNEICGGLGRLRDACTRAEDGAVSVGKLRKSEDLTRKTAEAGMQKTIRLRAHLHYASIYAQQKMLCPITLQLTYILVVLIMLVF